MNQQAEHTCRRASEDRRTHATTETESLDPVQVQESTGRKVDTLRAARQMPSRTVLKHFRVCSEKAKWKLESDGNSLSLAHRNKSHGNLRGGRRSCRFWLGQVRYWRKLESPPSTTFIQFRAVPCSSASGFLLVCLSPSVLTSEALRPFSAAEGGTSCL